MKWVFFILCLPVLEIMLFFKINELIGSVNTISFIIGTAVIGTIFVKKQIGNIASQIKEKGINPLSLISSGLLILFAGILLLTPGFITDTIGFFLLYPKIRQRIIHYLSKKFTPY
jgi:UPF0716 protein FxsA